MSRPRLSIVRIVTALALIGASFVAGARFASQALEADEISTSYWFAPYVDVTLPPFFDFQDPVANPNLTTVLAFVVASKADPCTPAWGAAYSLDEAAAQLDLDRRVVRVRQRGGDVIVSFGGVANDELASACGDRAALTAAYRTVIDRYDLKVIDLDLERDALTGSGVTRRAEVIAALQAERKAKGKKLDVWLTLPVAPHGLSQEALSTIDAMLAAKVDVAGVNVMTMDYGASRPAAVDFVTASLQGIDATATQLVTAYGRAGITFTPERIYAKIGVTPMIGQNDDPTDRLDTAGARLLLSEAAHRGVSRFSMWSLNRDAKCGGNVDVAIASNTCSGVDQSLLEFSSIFSAHASAPNKLKPAVPGGKTAPGGPASAGGAVPGGGNTSADGKAPAGGSVDGRAPAGGSVDGRAPAGGSVDGRAPAGGSVDGRAPAGGSVDGRAPAGGSVDGKAPPAGGSVDGKAPPAGGSVDGKAPPAGGSVDGKAPAGGGTTAGGKGPGGGPGGGPAGGPGGGPGGGSASTDGSPAGAGGGSPAGQTGAAALTPAGAGAGAPRPYAEWRARREYDAEARVVWRGMVYEAKWWNKLAQPDAPTERAWDSPWRALGPVLTSDVTPPGPPTLPPGTHPEWAQDKVYDKGDRVQYKGVGYRAKWWSRGDEPGADVDNHWDTPWEPIMTGG